MRVRFQADNDLNKAIVRAVVRREPSVDFRSGQAAGSTTFQIRKFSWIPLEPGASWFPHDFQTMPEHFREFALKHHTPGVLLIPQDLPIVLETRLRPFPGTPWPNLQVSDHSACSTR